MYMLVVGGGSNMELVVGMGSNREERVKFSLGVTGLDHGILVLVTWTQLRSISRLMANITIFLFEVQSENPSIH